MVPPHVLHLYKHEANHAFQAPAAHIVMACVFSTIFPPIPHPKSCYRSCFPIKSCRQTSSNDEGHDFNTFPEKIATNPTKSKPPRPRRIILVRHGQSEGNIDEHIYERVADPKVRLTEQGMVESKRAGVNIRRMIEEDGDDDWKVYFYVSPYRRSIETLRNLAKAFDKSRIAGVREEPRLREQDFGNFQDQEQMKLEKAARNLYGRFFYRFPDGESAADVYDRITGFRETLRHDIDIGRFQPPGEQSPNMNLVIVSHGLTLRVFLMRWYKWTVEQFEGLYNLGNNKMIVMERGYGGRYSLLMHHTKEELKEIGLTDEMLIDQEWQKYAKPGEVNYDCRITGASYFTHFEDEENKTSSMINLLSELA